MEINCRSCIEYEGCQRWKFQTCEEYEVDTCRVCGKEVCPGCGECMDYFSCSGAKCVCDPVSKFMHWPVYDLTWYPDGLPTDPIREKL